MSGPRGILITVFKVKRVHSNQNIFEILQRKIVVLFCPNHGVYKDQAVVSYDAAATLKNRVLNIL